MSWKLDDDPCQTSDVPHGREGGALFHPCVSLTLEIGSVSLGNPIITLAYSDMPKSRIILEVQGSMPTLPFSGFLGFLECIP
jgi:hypothetical protein